MARQGQALLKRHKEMTTEQFSDYWYKHHAPLVVPMFLSAGYTYYAQIHKPLSSTDASIDLSEWDGAAESTKGAEAKDVTNPGRDKYYREVVLADERRFLLSEALQHVKFVDRDSISGDKKVIIQGGKSLIEIPEEIMKVWNDYVQKGRVEVE